MAEKDELQWITVNGKHIPIKPGESKKEAISKAFGEDRDKFDNENSDKEVYDAYMKEAAEETARVNTGQQKKVKGQGVNIESDEIEEEPRFKEGSTVTVEDGSKGTIEKVFSKELGNNQYIVRFEDGTSGSYDDSDFADDGSYKGPKNEEPNPMNEFSGPDREGPSYAQLEANKQDQYRVSDKPSIDYDEIERRKANEEPKDEMGVYLDKQIDSKVADKIRKAGSEINNKSAEDKYSDYKEKGKSTWNQKLSRGDKVTFKDRDGNEIEGFINGFYKSGELQDEDTYEEGKDNLWHDFRGVNIVDTTGKDMGNINAFQILKHEKAGNNKKQLTPEQRQEIRNEINKMVASLDDVRSVDEGWDIEQGIIELEDMLKKFKGK